MLLRFVQIQNRVSHIHRRVTLSSSNSPRKPSTLTRTFTSLRHPGLQASGFRPLVMERPSKRARLSPDSNKDDAGLRSTSSMPLASLHRAITPPPRSRSRPLSTPSDACPELKSDQVLTQEPELAEANSTPPPQFIPSPIQLTHIQDFPASKGYNVDAVRLRDILGDPMIRECWNFNYLFDVDFVMSQFDEDVRSLVQVKVMHGSWEREAANRIRVDVCSPRAMSRLHLVSQICSPAICLRMGVDMTFIRKRALDTPMSSLLSHTCLSGLVHITRR